MNLLAHVTSMEGGVLVGAFVCGLLSGSLITWLTLALRVRKG